MAVDELAALLRPGATVHLRRRGDDTPGGDGGAVVASTLRCHPDGVQLLVDATTGTVTVGGEVDVTCPDDGRAHVCRATVAAVDPLTVTLTDSTDLRPVHRRRAQRLPVGFTMSCRRLGGRALEEPVQAVDLSMTGACIVAPPTLHTGDVVQLRFGFTDDDVACRGLVLSTSPSNRYRDHRHAHIVFTGVSARTGDRLSHLLDLQERALGLEADQTP